MNARRTETVSVLRSVRSNRESPGRRVFLEMFKVSLRVCDDVRDIHGGGTCVEFAEQGKPQVRSVVSRDSRGGERVMRSKAADTRTLALFKKPPFYLKRILASGLKPCPEFGTTMFADVYQLVYLDVKGNDVTTESANPTGYAVICANCWDKMKRSTKTVWTLTPKMAVDDWNRRIKDDEGQDN